MTFQILAGSVLIILTIIVQVSVLEFGQLMLQKYGNRILGNGNVFRKTMILSLATVWMLAGLSFAIAIWAIGFFNIQAFASFEESLYFALVSFTTLGFGDVILEQKWRLLSGIVAANGLILLGLNTAVLIDILARMRDGDMRTYNDEK